MTDPLKLAAWADDPQGRFDPAPVERRLIAAALRLSEAVVALSAHRDREPGTARVGEYTAWAEEETALALRAQDAEAAYRAAREGS